MFSQAGYVTSQPTKASGMPVSPKIKGEAGLWVNVETEDAILGGDGDEDVQCGASGPVEARGIDCVNYETSGRRIQRKRPEAPSQEETDDHMRTHVPFRSWCPVGVPGRKPNWGHYVVPDGNRQRDGPEIHFDYYFFREQKGAPAAPTLDTKDLELFLHMWCRTRGRPWSGSWRRYSVTFIVWASGATVEWYCVAIKKRRSWTCSRQWLRREETIRERCCIILQSRRPAVTDSSNQERAHWRAW